MKLALTVLLGMLFALPAHAELKIVATLPDYADLAKQIGKDKVSVHSVMRGPENVHNVLARPTDMLKINKADLFVHSGLDAEPWRDNLLKGGRNPRLMPGQPGNVDMSAGLELKEVPQGKASRAEGDVHAFGNPHFTPHPLNAARMAATLAQAMADADPANGDFYRKNARDFVVSITDVQKELVERLKPYQGLKVVTFHKAWEYFGDAFGLEIVTTIEPKPMITPSPAQMREVIETMKRQGVKIVICETYSSADQARSVAEAAGAQLLVLPDHVNGTAEAGNYQDLFRHDVGKLIEAAKAAGIPAK